MIKSAYSSDIFTSLEQPTLAKWNKLWDNDAFFASQINTNFSSGTTSKVWWEELGRTTLGGTATSLSVASLPARKFLMVLIDAIPSGSITQQLRFNNDSAANYSYRYSFNGGADSTGTSQTQGIWSPNGGAFFGQATLFITNIATQYKVVTCIGGDDAGAGAGTAPSRWEVTSKWGNNSVQINRIDISTATNNYAAGSSLIVLGHD